MGGGRGNATRRETQSQADGAREVGSAGRRGTLRAEMHRQMEGETTQQRDRQRGTHTCWDWGHRCRHPGRNWGEREGKRDTEPRKHPQAEA